MKNKGLLFGFSLFALVMFLVVAGSITEQAAADNGLYLEISPAKKTIVVGEVVQFEAILHDGGSSENITIDCDWDIDNSNIAAKTTAGAFKGAYPGDTNIRASYSGYKFGKYVFGENYEAVLVVKEAPAKLVIEPATAIVYFGDTQQYRAYLRYPDGTADVDVTEQCTWEVEVPVIPHSPWKSQPRVAKKTDIKGEFLAISLGSVKVKANYFGKVKPLAAADRGEVDLTTEAKMEAIQKEKQPKITMEVTPATASIMTGESQQYIATLHYSDRTPDKVVTDLATWTLSTNIADATGKGKYKGTTAGTATVKATYTPPGNSQLSDDAALVVGKPAGPQTEQLSEGKMIGRQPAYLALSVPQNMGTPADEFTMTYDAGKMDSNPDRHPQVYYWNNNYEKWVALASYPTGSGTIKALNDGHYSGWFTVMGCIQPTFTDTSGHWAEKFANRMNGLGLLEGYTDSENPAGLMRPAGLAKIISRAELTAAVARILRLAPGNKTLSYLSSAENDQILNAQYADAKQIPDWARPDIAAMTKAGLVNGKDGCFAPNDQLTRIEAAIMISNALKNVPGFAAPADLSTYADASQVPAWANGKVAQGTINGYPDGTLRPNQPIPRSETITLLLTLLRGLGW